MGRHPRIEGKALVYYVSSRGKQGQQIFREDQDKFFFIHLLKQQRIKSKLTFFGYVLLPELYAFLMETSRNNFIHSMHRIHSGYANYLNCRYRFRNKLFHDRYKSFIVEKKTHLLEVSQYLHLLPTKVGVVKFPIDYEWSSLPGYVYKKNREDWIDYNTVLNLVKVESERPSLSYKKYVDTGLREGLASPFKDLKKSIILGSKAFKKDIYENQLSNQITFKAEELNLAKSIIESVNQASCWPFLRIKGRRPPSNYIVRNAAIYFIKKFTDLNNLEISHLFQSLKKSSISQMSRRFKLAKDKNPSLEKISRILESKIKTMVLNQK